MRRASGLPVGPGHWQTNLTSEFAITGMTPAPAFVVGTPPGVLAVLAATFEKFERS